VSTESSGLQGHVTSLPSTPGPSVAPRDGDAESLTPGWREWADRRTRTLLVLDDALDADWAETIIAPPTVIRLEQWGSSP